MRRRSTAFTLVEIMVWLAILAILISLVSWAMASIADSARRGRRAVADATVRISVLQRLGGDVRNSSRILSQHAGKTTGEKTVILETPGSERIVYRFESGILYRDAKAAGAPRTVPIGRLSRLTFKYDTVAPAASRWVEVQMPAGTKKGLTQRFFLLDTRVTP